MGFIEPITAFWCVLVFFARVGDVTLGTIRTISIVHGRTRLAFLLGFFEVSLWITVVAKVLQEISSRPVLAIFYALGFSTGNVVGILIERRLAYGFMIVRVICAQKGQQVAEQLRRHGIAVTTFMGEGRNGPVTMLYIATRRRGLPELLKQVQEQAPDAFYSVEPASNISKLYQPSMPSSSSWLAIFKKK
jgi:uncharacterized protein YebE (UPF0316 family)